MMLEEEKKELVIQLNQAKVKATIFWERVLEAEKVFRRYKEDHLKWKTIYESADRKLAEEDRITKISSAKKVSKTGTLEDLTINLTKEQVLKIAENLGVEIEFED